jgi:hypothetical protein
MTSALLLALALTPGADLRNGPPLAPVTISPEAPFGFTYAPARDLARVVRYPAMRYDPRPGDVINMSDPTFASKAIYALALTGAPGHIGIVVRQPDGRFGILEAGFNGSLTTRYVPLDYRLAQYPGAVWVRRLRSPLTPDQDARLTEFAVRVDNTRYNLIAAKLQLTPLRNRGPLRTAVLGQTKGPDHPLFCSEAVVEALVYCGAIDSRTARPGATYPRDLFFDHSINPFVNRHPPLAAGWDIPALWTPVLGCAAKGKERPALDGVVVPPPPPAPRRFRR